MEPVELMDPAEQLLNSTLANNLATTMETSVLDTELVSMIPVFAIHKLEVDLDMRDLLVTSQSFLHL